MRGEGWRDVEEGKRQKKSGERVNEASCEKES